MFVITERIVSVELVGVVVIEFVGVPKVVATGGQEGLFLVTHLPDLQNYFARRENYETAIKENHETDGRDETEGTDGRDETDVGDETDGREN